MLAARLRADKASGARQGARTVTTVTPVTTVTTVTTATSRPAHPPAPPWDQVRALFEALCAQPASAREAALALQPPALADEVRSLLSEHDAEEAAGSGFLARPAADGLLDGLADRPSDPAAHPGAEPPAGAVRAGQRLGAWRLVSPIGRGGMGEVWLAERADGAWRGEAAVKLLQRGLDSRAVLARFAQERQALARLQHPNIAHLLDAGATPDGLPYFVMERVRGQRIDQACAGRPLAERLRLLLQLADAVSHAHRKLLLHRDLKPGNVLVTEAGEVKLLDFGIAKALAGPGGRGGEVGPGDDPGDAGAEATQLGLRPFSPHYASPEQLRGEPVGTASDVFGLGVLMAVVLTGRKPHGDGEAGVLAAARAVLDDPPVPPSRLFDPTLPAARGLTRAELAGDIDAIVLHALHKAPEQRYPSVDALAADLRAHLAGDPVSVRPPAPLDRVLRLVRRHRVAAAAAALGAVGLLAGLAAALLHGEAAVALGMGSAALALALALWQLGRAARARRLAESRLAQVRQLARSLVFDYHDRIAMLPGSTQVRAALLGDAVRTLDALVGGGAGRGPAVDPALAREAAETYLRVAVLQGESFSPSQERLADAEANLDRALALLPLYLPTGRPGQPAPPPDALHAAADMWLARTTQRARRGRLAPALQALEQAAALADRTLAAAPQDLQALSRVATVAARRGMLLGHNPMTAQLGRLDEALPHLDRAVALMRQLMASEPSEPEWMHQAAWALQARGHARLLGGDAAAAVADFEPAVALRDRASAAQPGNAHWRHQRFSVRSSLAQALAALGRADAAQACWQEAERIAGATAAADPGNRAAARDVVGLALVGARLRAQAGGPPGPARAAFEALLPRLPQPEPGSDDFYLARWQVEALLWCAWLTPADEAAQALEWAARARALMGGDDDNAARRWAQALALEQEARALQRLGRAAEAAERQAAARTAWAATPSGRPPLYRDWPGLASGAGPAPVSPGAGAAP
jgi:serine/threonine protein kinase/tetratricopeptide (TPR) repeat protein